MAILFTEPAITPYLIPVKQPDGIRLIETNDLAWTDLATQYRTITPTTALYFLPPEYYLELLFLHTCDAHHITAIMGSVFNLPWVTEALAISTCEAIVSTDSVLPYLLKKINHTPAWQHLKQVTLVGPVNQYTKDAIKTLPAHVTLTRLPHPFTP